MSINAVKAWKWRRLCRGRTKGREHRDEMTPKGFFKQSRRRCGRWHFQRPRHHRAHRLKTTSSITLFQGAPSTATAAPSKSSLRGVMTLALAFAHTHCRGDDGFWCCAIIYCVTVRKTRRCGCAIRLGFNASLRFKLSAKDGQKKDCYENQ